MPGKDEIVILLNKVPFSVCDVLHNEKLQVDIPVCESVTGALPCPDLTTISGNHGIVIWRLQMNFRTERTERTLYLSDMEKVFKEESVELFPWRLGQVFTVVALSPLCLFTEVCIRQRQSVTWSRRKLCLKFVSP